MTLFEQVVLTADEREAYERCVGADIAIVVPLTSGRWAIFNSDRILMAMLDSNSLARYLKKRISAEGVEMKLARIADKIAADVYRRPINKSLLQSAVIRNACDIATGSDLSMSMLERLSDMVERRLKKMRHDTARENGR